MDWYIHTAAIKMYMHIRADQAAWVFEKVQEAMRSGGGQMDSG